MLNLSAKIREKIGRENRELRKKELLPAVLYGPRIKNLNLEIKFKEFEDVYKKGGESSLISLTIEGSEKKYLVLIHNVQFDPLSGRPIHVDFYQPSLKEDVEVVIPICFEGISPAVKNLGGTLVKHISEVKVRAKPQNLPHEIKVNIEKLETFDDEISIKDLTLPEGVKIQRSPDDIVANVSQPEKIEEELEKPIEEKVEEVERVEEKKKEEEKIESEEGEKES